VPLPVVAPLSPELSAADSGGMPETPGAPDPHSEVQLNTMAPCVIIGERAAEILKSQHTL